MAETGTNTSTDGTAIVTLVLAFVAPPIGAPLAIYGGRDGGRMSWLRVAAVVVRVIGTLLGITLLAGQDSAG